MNHIGDFIQSGLLRALGWDDQQNLEEHSRSINMGGPSPTVSYGTGKRSWSSGGSFPPQQFSHGALASMPQNAVWNPEQQDAYPILPTAAQGLNGQASSAVQEPYYMVGRRPLDWKWQGVDLGKWIYNDEYFGGSIGGDYNLRAEHQHFIGSHNKNFGFTDTGEFEEKGRENDYTYDVPNIGDTKFKAKYMDMARLIAKEQIEADVDQMKDLMDAFSIEDGEYMVKEYSFQSRNCQEYVDKVIGIARELAKRNGDTLEIILPDKGREYSR